jgi:hypothetical protein
MHEQREKTIRTNLQTAINHLHSEKDLVIDRISFYLSFNIKLFFRKQKIVLLNIQINLTKSNFDYNVIYMEWNI